MPTLKSRMPFEISVVPLCDVGREDTDFCRRMDEAEVRDGKFGLISIHHMTGLLVVK